MLIGGIILGLVLGLLLGGRLERLAEIRLRYLPLLFVAVILRFGTEALLGTQGDLAALVDTLRVPLLGLAYAMLLFVLWNNRGYPGLALAFVGILFNAIVIVVNGGRMPVWMPAYEASGLSGPLSSVLHYPIQGNAVDFLVHLGPLGDIIPLPIPPVQNVASVGDLFLTAGLAFFLFATLLRAPDEIQSAIVEARLGRYAGTPPPPFRLDEHGRPIPAGTGLSPALEATAVLERPQLLGAGGVGLASPSATAYGAEAGAIGVAVPRRRPLPALERVRRHPYVRLGLNGSFSALWMGQVISLFGDRVNQIALMAFVYEVTKSPIAVALTPFMGTIPNLVFSPLAGTFVDRWDQKQVLVVSDLLRAALVLLIPVAVLVNVWLAYPLVFLITTVTIFFRPARIAVLPRLVQEDELLAANSAMWVGETLADVVNYPLAGLFVVFLANALPIAFWFDAATYVASAALIGTILVPPLVRRLRGEEEAETPTTVIADLKEGWAFLRHETVLLANTLQGTVGQFAAGIMTAGAIVLAAEITKSPGDEYRATYAFMEASIGIGNLLGGFAIGLFAGRARKGPMVTVAYIVFGACLFLVGVGSSVPFVLAMLFGVGVANMAFIIPSQTMFQERTPPELIGRVVSFRFALVLGFSSIAMAVAGLLINDIGPGPVIAAAGILSICAGVAGLFVRAVREA